MTRENRPFTIRRRALLSAAVAGLAMPRVLHAQTPEKVRFTLPWLAQGSTAYPYVAKAMGFWSKRGLDVDIARGFGSVAAAQAIGGGRFDFGIVQAPSIVLQAAKGLPIMCLGIGSYSAGWGIGLREDSPISRAKDLEGKKIGAVVNSGEFPFLPLYAERSGIDMSKVQLVQIDNKILEQTLINRNVDAISAVASSSAPVVVAQGGKVRFLMFKDVGLDLYGTSLCAPRALMQTRPDLCQKMVEGSLEALAYTLTNPKETLDILYRAVPEVALATNGQLFTEFGLGMFQNTVISAEAEQNGMGWGDRAKIDAMIDLVIRHTAEPGTPRPPTEEVFDTRFAGTVKLTAAQWRVARENAAPYARYLETQARAA
jgi:ABC-type nitrate/sulfonate/bicarbonate transport system substrate-binding protein